MKKANVYLLFLLLAFQFAGCYKTDDGAYVEPITIYEKIHGVWNLSSLKYVDEYAKSNNIEPNEDNLTNWFNYKDFQLTLNVDESNQPVDYSVAGDVPELIPSTGYWKLSSAFPTTNMQPVLINLYADAAKTDLTGQLHLISIPGVSTNMEVQLVRSSNNVAFASYMFKLFPAN